MGSRAECPAVDFFAPGAAAFGVESFPSFLARRLRHLTIPQRTTLDLLTVLLRQCDENRARSRRGAAWAKPSQTRLGALTPHRWADEVRGLSRRRVNALVGLLAAKGVIRMTRRGRIASGRGYRLSNLVRPGPWLWRQWAIWCGLVVRRLRNVSGATRRDLPLILRQVLNLSARSSRLLFGEKSSAPLCAGPSALAQERAGAAEDAAPPPAPDLPPHAPGSPEWEEAKRRLYLGKRNLPPSNPPASPRERPPVK